MNLFISVDLGGDWVKHLAQQPDISVKVAAELALEPVDIVLVPNTTEGALQVRALPTPSSP